jgi:hypothetical protein
LKWILKYLDDLVLLPGIASLTYAGFLYSEIEGYAVLGIGLIACSVMIARGGDGA